MNPVKVWPPTRLRMWFGQRLLYSSFPLGVTFCFAIFCLICCASERPYEHNVYLNSQLRKHKLGLLKTVGALAGWLLSLGCGSWPMVLCLRVPVLDPSPRVFVLCLVCVGRVVHWCRRLRRLGPGPFGPCVLPGPWGSPWFHGGHPRARRLTSRRLRLHLALLASTLLPTSGLELTSGIAFERHILATMPTLKLELSHFQSVTTRRLQHSDLTRLLTTISASIADSHFLNTHALWAPIPQYRHHFPSSIILSIDRVLTQDVPENTFDPLPPPMRSRACPY